jgi:hypothetical protein
MQRDLKWYASLPLQAVSTYAEPADWGTYEANHVVFGHLAWDPAVDVDSLLAGWAGARFGAAAPTALAALSTLEDEFRPRASLPYSRPSRPAEIAAALDDVERRLRAVDAARAAASTRAVGALERLALMLEYARRDLDLQRARASGEPAAALRRQASALFDFLHDNADRGVFLIHDGDRPRVVGHYSPDR